MSASRIQHINPDEFAVGRDPDLVFATLLGSCVAVCLHDPVAGVGGMNHIRLPCDNGAAGSDGGPGPETSLGINAMERLINAIVAAGGDRQRLVAKVFGGGRMVAGLSDIGRRNSEFVMRFLAAEAIPCVSASIGGAVGRKLQFWPRSGRARQKLLQAVPDPAVAAPYRGNGMDLF